MMKMNVIWHKQAWKALRETATYIRKNFSLTVKENFRDEVNRVELLLQSNPYLGSVEPLLADFPDCFRSIVVNRLNKIVYYVEDDTIHIADFWDTRREPKKQAQQTIDSLNS